MATISRRSVAFGLALGGTLGILIPRAAALAGDQAPLAIRGYDPVAYFTVGKPVRGLPAIDYQWDERRYLFATAEHRDLFRADPVRYAPQFANYCAMALTRGELHEADPENWLITDGKLYLFAEDYGPGRFREDLSGNIGKASLNRSLIPRP